MNASTPTEAEVMEGVDRQIAQLRVPPHSVEAESSVLGGLLLESSAWDRVADILSESDFYRHEHRLIYSALSQLVNSNKPADVVTVYSHLQDKAGEVGGMAYLNSLAQYVPSAGNIRRYAEIVRERSVLRQLVAASDEIATSAFNPQGRPVAQILDEAQQSILVIGESASTAETWVGIDENVVELLDHIQEVADGTATADDFIPTGLDELDEMLNGGMRGGQVITIAGRPSMGKTAMAMTIEKHVSVDQGLPTGFFSMEMPRRELTQRKVSMLSNIHLSRIQRPERLKDFDWSALTKAIDTLRKSPLYIDDRAGLNINQVRSKARALRTKRGLRLLIVDYLGLMAGTDARMARAYQIEEITKGLKGLAKELNVPIILLAQVGREAEKRINSMPILSDLRDSGSIEQDSDIVIFVHRPIKAKPELGDEWKYYARVSIAKQRQGPTGEFDLMYVGENTRFMNWPEETPVPGKGGGNAGGDERKPL